VDTNDYQELTRSLTASLEARSEVLGLVALGSMARMGIEPDSWSDHDFFVIVPPGLDERYRTDLSWIPNPAEIVLSFRETAHGLKVLYRNGHLLEFAVFTPEQLLCARINRYRILFERTPLAATLERLRDAGRVPESPESPESFVGSGAETVLLGKFLCNLVVGTGRFMRGEQLSAHLFVKSHALTHLLELCRRRSDSAVATVADNLPADNLDPFRRFECAFPGLAAEIHAALAMPVPAAAAVLMQLAVRVVGAGPGHQLFNAFETVRLFLEKTARASA